MSHNRNRDTVVKPLSQFNLLQTQGKIRLLYSNLDPGVDDSFALMAYLGAKINQPDRIEILGIVPCVGNAVLSQTEQNVLAMLTLTENTAIPVY